MTVVPYEDDVGRAPSKMVTVLQHGRGYERLAEYSARLNAFKRQASVREHVNDTGVQFSDQRDIVN